MNLYVYVYSSKDAGRDQRWHRKLSINQFRFSNRGNKPLISTSENFCQRCRAVPGQDNERVYCMRDGSSQSTASHSDQIGQVLARRHPLIQPIRRYAIFNIYYIKCVFVLRTIHRVPGYVTSQGMNCATSLSKCIRLTRLQ